MLFLNKIEKEEGKYMYLDKLSLIRLAEPLMAGRVNTEPRPAEMKESTIPLHLVLP